MDATQKVKDALHEYYQSHYFGIEAFTAKWVWVKLGLFKFPFPNLKQRREAIYLHDLTHLITGYDTSWTGEGEVAAWELASGFPTRYWIGWVYSPMTFSVGLIISPLKVMRAFRRGFGMPNLYQLQIDRVQLDEMTLAEVKAKLVLKP